MSHTYPATLHKQERICSKKLIDAIFAGTKSRSMSAFPLRVVYMPLDEEHNGNSASEQEDGNMPNTQRPKAKMLISVPKRYFKRAVKRNRVKRLLREVYRHHQDGLRDDIAVLLVGRKAMVEASTDEVSRTFVGLAKRAKAWRKEADRR